MPTILLETKINAPIAICFDLSRSIDLHMLSTSKTKEVAIEGKTSGLISLNESVTWEATHFGIKQRLTSIITEYQSPYYFKDEQLKGAFAFFKHEHIFIEFENYTLMKDIFEFDSPFGVLGKLVNVLILKNYLKRFLVTRNNAIKDYAENGKFKELI